MIGFYCKTCNKTVKMNYNDDVTVNKCYIDNHIIWIGDFNTLSLDSNIKKWG